MLSRNLEQSLHRALAHANERRHEYATLEHLLLALVEDQDALAVLKACGVDIDRLRRDLNANGNALHPELANALSKMVLYFDNACDAFQRGDEKNVADELQRAEYQTAKVMKHFGR